MSSPRRVSRPLVIGAAAAVLLVLSCLAAFADDSASSVGLESSASTRAHSNGTAPGGGRRAAPTTTTQTPTPTATSTATPTGTSSDPTVADPTTPTATSSATQSSATQAPAGPSRSAGYPFGPTSVWRSDVSAAPVASNSAALVSSLVGTVTDRYNGVAAFNAYRYNNSFYTVGADTARVDVAFNDCQHKGYTPAGLTGPGGQFTGVPVPAGAVPSPGTDKALSIYSPATDQLWELWGVEQTAPGRWSACWGGRIDTVSTSPGYFLNGFGATASGLSSSGGMVRLADVRSGSIDHALSLSIPDPAAGIFSWPAQRTDGTSTSPAAVPEGTRLRLDPSLDIDSLHLHPVAAMIAHAAQRYGFVVVDKSGAVSVIGESGAPEQAATGVDPWAALLGGTPDYAVLANFPWNRLQALPQDYGKP